MDFPRLLVLGATGRIGAILRRVWEPGRATWQARRRPGPPGAAGWAVFDPLADPGALGRAVTGCDAVLCLAGVTPARAARGAAMADNITLAEAAIRAAAEAGAGAQVLLASSAAVYGARAGVLAETDTPAPVSEYGRAKAGMETRGAALGRALGVPVCALRIGNVAGADAILGGWRPGFALDRFADGRTPRRSYVGPVTLARVLAQLAARRDLPDRLNIAAPGVVEMGALLDAAGLGWTPRPAPDTAIAEVALDTRRLERIVDLPAQAGSAAQLVAEWRQMGVPEA
jgi:nucleoside-diphosphate-sugar epimerase